MDPAILVDLAGRFLAFDERERAAASWWPNCAVVRTSSSTIGAAMRRRSSSAGSSDRRGSSRTARSRSRVIDYQTPDHVLTSGNVGDYVQTLAMLGNLVPTVERDVHRRGRPRRGRDRAAGARARPTLRTAGPTGAIHLMPVDRDFSSASAVPDGTWLFAFGWHMHSLFDLR